MINIRFESNALPADTFQVLQFDGEGEGSSTLNSVVPVMIRTKDGWEFKAPLTNPGNKNGQQRKVNWL